MNDTVHIRLMETGDAETVAVLAAQLGYERRPEQIVEWLATCDLNTQSAFVAVLRGEVVGWIEVSIVRHLQSDPHAFIGGLVVKEGTRGAGIGRLLCAHAEQWGRDHGLASIRLTSRATRTNAHRFYERDGYTRTKLSVYFEKAL